MNTQLRDMLVSCAIQWAWEVPNNESIPKNMKEELAAEGVYIKANNSTELLNELDQRGDKVPGGRSPKMTPEEERDYLLRKE